MHRDAPEQRQKGRRPADTFSNRLILTVRLTGLTIREFAESAGLDDGSVSNWTHGMRPRDMVGVCQAIADAHDIDFDWLLLGGPLLPARGRLTKRTRDLTPEYLSSAVRLTGSRPIDLSAAASSSRPDRRPRMVDRAQPAAA